MSRLIDADKMTADLLTVDPQYETMIKWCLTVLDAQPTIEERNGRWIYSAQGYTCSECKTQFPSEVHYLNPEYTLPKHCPECGARLEE